MAEVATQADYISAILEYKNTIRELKRSKDQLTRKLIDQYCPFKVGDVVQLSTTTPNYRSVKIGKIVKITVALQDDNVAQYEYVIYEYSKKTGQTLHRRLYYYPQYTEIRLIKRKNGERA